MMAEAGKRFLVVGAGKFGQGVARALGKRGCEVIALDRDGRKLADLADAVSKTVQLDATDDAALAGALAEAGGVVDVAIVSIGDDVQASLLIVMALKEAGVPTVVAKALTESHGKVLTRVGVDRIVYPERDMGMKLASVLVSPTIFDHVEVGPGYAILEIAAATVFWGKSLAESQIRAAYGVSVIAIKPPDPERHETVVAPPAETVINEGDILVVIGKDGDVERFREIG
jgi:trk system potassium uptake protein TrkA